MAHNIFTKLRRLFRKEKKIESEIEKNLGVFIREEEKEAKKLLKGQESFSDYVKDSSGIFEDYFIPTSRNNHKPKILRPKPLLLMALILILLKVTVAGYLFIVYQEEAKMAENINNRLLELINRDRQSDGQAALSLNAALTRSALMKADSMVKDGYFAHTSPDGRHPWDFIDRAEYPYAFVGENLAMNFVDADDVHIALMASPSHKKNILNERYADIGLAVATGEINGSRTNVLVEMFGVKTETALAKAPAATPVAIPAKASPPAQTAAEKTPAAPKTGNAEVLGSEKPDSVVPTASTPLEKTPKRITADLTSPTSEAISEIVERKASPLRQASGTPADEGGSSQALATTNGADNLTASGSVQEKAALASLETMNPGNPDPLELNRQVIQISRDDNQKLAQAFALTDYLKIFYVIFLVFMLLSLLLNIFIRFSIQHKSVLVQSALLILLAVVLATYNFGFIERVRDIAENIVLL